MAHLCCLITAHADGSSLFRMTLTLPKAETSEKDAVLTVRVLPIWRNLSDSPVVGLVFAQ